MRNVIEMYGRGRFNGLGLTRPSEGTPGAAPPPGSSTPTATPEELAKQAAQRWASIAAAKEATAAGATAKEVEASRTSVYLAKGVQIDAERAGKSSEEQAVIVAEALAAAKQVAEAQQALREGGLTPEEIAAAQKAAADAQAALDAAKKQAEGSNIIYYVAGGLVLVGILGTIVLSRRPALAGVNHRRKRKGRASWIR